MMTPTLRKIQESIERLLILGNRLIVIGVIGGSVFTATAILLAFLLASPQALLKTQGYEINVLDSQWEPSSEKDSNWDGMLAGASMGYSYGHAIPFWGSALGAAIGASVGYRLDDRI